MMKSVLFAALAGGAVALGLGACDEQQASDSSSVPMQQEGAVPPAENDSAAPAMQQPNADPTVPQPDAGGSSSQ